DVPGFHRLLEELRKRKPAPGGGGEKLREAFQMEHRFEMAKLIHQVRGALLPLAQVIHARNDSRAAGGKEPGVPERSVTTIFRAMCQLVNQRCLAAPAWTYQQDGCACGAHCF